jgi:acyl-CoA thioester hydrolase
MRSARRPVMPDVFHYQRRVEFCETDAAGIAHFSSFFLYMEQAEHAFLRSVGLSVDSDLPPSQQGERPTHVSWPRVKADCEYQSGARFEEVLDIAVRIARLGEKSVTYAFEITCSGRAVATGHMVSVFCAISPGEAPDALPIPESYRAALARHVFGA